MRLSETATILLDHTRWRHIWQLAWPIMLSNVTIPLVGAVDVAMMGRLDDPVFIGGVGLGMSCLISSISGSAFCGWEQPVLLPKCMALVRIIKLPFY